MADEAADTVSYYDCNAERFATDTGALNMSVLHERFLRHIPPGGRILDAGCGGGRDALVFTERGYEVVAFDASTEMAKRAAEQLAGRAKILRMRYEDVAWHEEFDGIWACASLLHVPTAAFSGVASRLADALRAGGAWYMSFKFGQGERQNDGRLFVDHTENTLCAALSGIPISVADVWISNDVRPGRQDEKWVNLIAFKTFSTVTK